tara:strand:- start:702 stop:983 length:282 start_codon:yes stop_codon:yes gene_type:complete
MNNRYYIQRISAETCEDILLKYDTKSKEDIVIVRMYDEPFDLTVKHRVAMTSEEFANFKKLVNGSGEFKDILEIIVRKKEAEQLDKISEENNQ